MKFKKRIIVGFIIAFLLTIVFFSLFLTLNQEQNKMKNLNTVPLSEWKSLYDNDKSFVIIDVRTPNEFEEGYIENAININFYDSNFKEQLNKLDKNKKYLIYCRSGARSSKTLEMMKELNFNEVYDLQGGFLSWSSAKYKIINN